MLGVAADAPAEEIRAAYLAKVKQFPPDRNPEEFEKIRDAYERIRDPRSRAKALLAAEDPLPLVRLLDGLKASRRFVGPELWIEAMKKTK
jgi:curved DNA-binding protein CbpA